MAVLREIVEKSQLLALWICCPRCYSQRAAATPSRYTTKTQSPDKPPRHPKSSAWLTLHERSLGERSAIACRTSKQHLPGRSSPGVSSMRPSVALSDVGAE